MGSGIDVAEWGGVAEGVGVGVGVAIGVGVAEGVGIGVAVGVGVAEGVGIGVSGRGVGVTEEVGGARVGWLKESGSQGYRPRAMCRWKIKVGQIVACSFCRGWGRIDAFSVPCKDGKPIRRDTAFQDGRRVAMSLEGNSPVRSGRVTSQA